MFSKSLSTNDMMLIDLKNSRSKSESRLEGDLFAFKSRLVLFSDVREKLKT